MLISRAAGSAKVLKAEYFREEIEFNSIDEIQSAVENFLTGRGYDVVGDKSDAERNFREWGMQGSVIENEEGVIFMSLVDEDGTEHYVDIAVISYCVDPGLIDYCYKVEVGVCQ